MVDTAISPTEADRLAIRELVDAYAHCADRRDAEGQKALFTEDTHFVVYMDGQGSEPTQVLDGREALTPVFDDLNRYQATIHFNPRDHLPLSIEYKSLTAEGEVLSETRYFRWVEFGGVQFPTIQDFYRNGKQSARVSFDDVNLNANLADKLFAKPANIKEVK